MLWMDLQLKPYSQYAVRETGGDYPERADLTGGAYMPAYAWTGIVVADLYNAQPVSGRLRQALEVELILRFLSRNEILAYRHICLYNVVDALLKLRLFFGAQVSGEPVVAFGFIFFYMGAESPPAA